MPSHGPAEPKSRRTIGPHTAPPAIIKPPVAKAAPGHAPVKNQQINFQRINEALDKLMPASEAEMTIITSHPELKDDVGHAVRKAKVEKADADVRDGIYANWVLTSVHLGEVVGEEIKGEEIKNVSDPTSPDKLIAAAHLLLEHYAQDPKYSDKQEQVQVHISRAIDYNRFSWLLNQLSNVSDRINESPEVKPQLEKLDPLEHSYKKNPPKKKKEREKIQNDINRLKQGIEAAVKVSIKTNYKYNKPYFDYAVSWMIDPRPPGDPETAFDRLKDLLKAARDERLERADTQVLLNVIIQSARKMGLFDENANPDLLKTFSEIVTDPKNSTAELISAYNEAMASSLKGIDPP
jgi:hypothetical protein